jgi:hypothetical protein
MPMRIPAEIIPSPRSNSWPRVWITSKAKKILVTPRQRDVYLFIRHWWRLYGYSPTHKEIANGLGLKNGNHVGQVVKRLMEMGVVTRERKKKRSVRPSGIALSRLVVLDGAAGYV